MKKLKFISLMIAFLALASCNKENPFTPELGVNNTSDIQVSSSQNKAHLTVTANISWTATSDARWITLTPPSKQITDKTSNATELEIAIDENSAWDARTATITIKAEGCKDITINVKQSAKTFSPSFSVVDDKGASITAPLEIGSNGGELQLKVVSNISWKAEASASWLTVLPSEKQNTSKNVETTDVKVTIPANTDQERSATITFKAEGQNDIVVTVNQKARAAISIDIKVSDITYNGAKITWTPSDNNVYCLYSITSKEYYSQFKTDQEIFEDDYDYYVNEVYPDYADEYSLEEFLFGILSTKGASTNSFIGEFKPETTYIAYAYVMNNDGNGKASLGSKVYAKEFTTAKQPAYTGELVLGDYLMSDPIALDQPSSNVFTLESADMGETNYYIRRICTKGDTFAWKATYDKTAGTLTVSGIAAGYESEGCLFTRILWQIGNYYSGYWSGANNEGKVPLVFSVDSKTKKINGLLSGGIGQFAAENNNGQYEIRGFFGRYLKESTTIEYQTPATTANGIATNSKKPVFNSIPLKNISGHSVRMR